MYPKLTNTYRQHLLSLFAIFYCLFVNGQDNKSMHFDNIDDYINVGQYLNFDNTDTFTIETWIKTDVSTGYHQIICKLDSNYKGWGFQMVDGKLSGYLYSNYAGAIYIYETGATTISDNTWHHVAMVYDGMSSIKLYVDGNQETTTPLSGGTLGSVANNGDTIIGSYYLNTSGIDLWPGYLDDLRVWNTAFTTTQIANNYTQELSGSESGLLLYYKFDKDNTTCDVVDCSPNNVHGNRIGDQGTNNLPQYNSDTPTITDATCTNQNCIPLSTENYSLDSKRLFYPNPSKGTLFLNDKFDTITIINLLGKKVYHQEHPKSNLDIKFLHAGMYLITFSKNSNIVTERLIVQ